MQRYAIVIGILCAGCASDDTGEEDQYVELDCAAYCNVMLCLENVPRDQCMGDCACMDAASRPWVKTCMNECGNHSTCQEVEACTCEFEDPAAEDERIKYIQDRCVDHSFYCGVTADGCQGMALRIAYFDDASIDRMLACYSASCDEVEVLTCQIDAQPLVCQG